MHEALLLVARTITLAHDHWRGAIGRRRPLSGKIAVLEELDRQLEAEGALLRARFLRVPGLRRPHYRQHERLEILWHAARYRLSIAATADVFCLTRQTILNWRAVMRRKDATLLPPSRGLPDLVRELVQRLKAEWPAWGTRRIAGHLARLGVKASRSSVQRILRRPRVPTPDGRLLPGAVAGLLAKHPNHIWMIDFTWLKGIVRPVFVGAVIDAFSRKVLTIGFIRGEPDSRFASRLLRSAISKCRDRHGPVRVVPIRHHLGLVHVRDLHHGAQGVAVVEAAGGVRGDHARIVARRAERCRRTRVLGRRMLTPLCRG